MGVGPDARHQLGPADHFTGALNQGDQDVESPTAETNALVALEQQTLLWNQAKGAKRDRALARGNERISHLCCRLGGGSIVQLATGPLCRLQTTGLEPFGEASIARRHEIVCLRTACLIAP